MNLTDFRCERRRLAQAKRRIIYNNDGDDSHYPHVPSTAAEFLARRTTGMENTLVDTISYCTILGFSYGNHNSRVCDMPLSGEEGVVAAPGGWNHPDVLIDGDRDCLQITIDFCRRHNIEVWASIRMNDRHDQNSPNIRSPWKGEHPERWLAQPPDLGGDLEERAFVVMQDYVSRRWLPKGVCMCWYSADYERQDVRDRMYELIADVGQRYDLDGIELDFLRGPLYFRANAQGRPDAGQENRDKMTALLGRVREMTEAAGMRRGRPMVIAARVPDDVGMASAIGLETPRWLKQNLIDILIAGTAWRTRPWKELVALGHNHDVPVYACATEHGAPHEVIRGRALAAWADGVDGIYTFNNFSPGSPVFTELGDLEKLLQLDRTTPVDNACLGPGLMTGITLLPEWSRFLAPAPRLPLALPPDEDVFFEFAAAEEGARVAVSGTPHVILRLMFHNIEAGDEIAVTLNDHSLRGTESKRDCPKPGWISWRVDPSFLRCGDNLLGVRLEKRADRVWGELALANVQLRVTAQREALTSEIPPAAAAARPLEEVAAAGELEKVAFLLTEDGISLPPGQVNAQRQWLLDKLNHGRPMTLAVRKFVEKHSNYPPDPLEEPLPGWDSLAVLFDTDEMGDPLDRDIVLAVLKAMAPAELKSEAGLYVGYLGIVDPLAAVVIRSRSADDMQAVVRGFGAGAGIKGLLPLPIRFLRAVEDGNLIPRTFSILFRGTLQDGVFTQAEEGRWQRNLLSEEDLAASAWRLAQSPDRAAIVGIS